MPRQMKSEQREFSSLLALMLYCALLRLINQLPNVKVYSR